MFYMSREMKDFLEVVSVLKNPAVVFPVMITLVGVYILLAGILSLLG